MKKLLIFIAILCIVFSSAFSGFAETVQPNPPAKITVSDFKANQNDIEKSNLEGIPAQNSNNPNASQDSLSTQAASVNTITPFFIRSGNTSEVHVYLSYNGTDAANAIKYSSLKINNTSLLFPTTYTSFPGKTHDFNYATTFYNVPIGVANIPTNVTKVRVSDSGLMAYQVQYGWNSFSNIIGEWPIQ